MSTARLTIILDDVNDNSPVFTPSATYFAQISEASQPGLNVKQLLATDADKHSDPIRYFIVHGTEQSNAFEISDDNRESGVITLKRAVDRERYQWINFTVLAVDSGTPALTATAIVAVEITDINDNSPEWQALPVTVHLWENATIGTEVTTVWAVDRDGGEFGKVMYFMNDGAFGKFQISNTTVSVFSGSVNMLTGVHNASFISVVSLNRSRPVWKAQYVCAICLVIIVPDVLWHESNDFINILLRDKYVVQMVCTALHCSDEAIYI